MAGKTTSGPAQHLRALTGHAGRMLGSKSGQMLLIGFVNIGLGLAVTMLLARLMMPSEFGEYALALNLAQMLTMPVEFGLLTLTVREIARSRAREDDEALAAMVLFAATMLMTTFVLLVAGLAVSEMLGFTVSELPRTLQYWTLAAVLPLALMNWARGILLGFERAIDSALSENILRPMLHLLFVVGLAIWGSVSSTGAMVAQVAALALCFFWSVWRMRSSLAGRIRLPLLRRDHFTFKSWFGALLPLSLINGARMINRRIDVVMVGFLANTVAVAGYTIAMQLTSVILVAQTVLNGLISPKVAYAFEAGQTARLQRILARTTLISCAFAMAAALGILIIGLPVITLLFGASYSHAWQLSLILAVGQLFSGLMGPTALMLNMTSADKKTLGTGILAAVLNVALSALLIPPLGSVGAAIASSTTLVAIQTQRWAMAWRHTGVRTDIFAALAHIRAHREPTP